jgi:peptidoglycan hydrolase CwlO-like protein
VNKIYDRGRAKLISTAQAMGLTKAEAQKLASQILKTPDKTAKLKGNLEDLQTKLDKAKAQLKTVPDSRKAKVQANISQLKAQVAAAKRAIASVTGKTVNLIVKTSTTTGSVAHEGGGYAHGGIVGAYANGGTTSGRLSLVGEQGPELVRLPVGSTVYPAGQSQRMMDDGAEPVRAYAKGGKVTAAEKSARSAAMGSFGMSYFARMAGAQHTSFESSVGSPGSLGDLVSTLNQWRASIKAATSGGVEKSLLAGLTRAGKGLIAHEKALTKVNAALSSAKDKLTSLKDAASQLRDSVASGIVSGANITGTAQGTGLTSTGRILDQLTQDRDKASSLAGALKTLKGRGLNSQSLSEIASAGVQGGGLATAEALMSASGGDIQQINQLEKQLKLSAASAGKTTADSMYGAGIKAADGLVKGLEKQQHRLDAVMAKAAKALEKAIEKAFKGKASGGIVGAATGGARGGLTWVGEQGPELARLPYGSTVYPAGQSRQMAAAGGGGSAPVHFHISVGGKDMGEIVLDPLRKTIKTRGGNVQAVLGG